MLQSDWSILISYILMLTLPFYNTRHTSLDGRVVNKAIGVKFIFLNLTNRSKVCCKAGSVDLYKQSTEKVAKVWAESIYGFLSSCVS